MLRIILQNSTRIASLIVSCFGFRMAQMRIHRRWKNTFMIDFLFRKSSNDLMTMMMMLQVMMMVVMMQ
jgi:hypothetical protein